MERIKAILELEAAAFDGVLAAAFKDCRTGWSCHVNGDRPVYMASTFKVYVLIAFYELVRQGKLGEFDLYTVLDEDYLDDTTILHPRNPRREFMLAELANYMMILSDNTATDILWRLVGAENVMAAVRMCGGTDTRVTKNCRSIINGFYGLTPEDGPEEIFAKLADWRYTEAVEDKDNVGTANDMARTLELILCNGILDEYGCRRILEIMSGCLLNARIPALLPDRAGVAHKTGTIGGCINDVGIVYTPAGSFILTLYTTSRPRLGISSRSIDGERLCARLTRSLYDAYLEING